MVDLGTWADLGTRAALADLGTSWAGRRVAPPKRNFLGEIHNLGGGALEVRTLGGALEAQTPGVSLEALSLGGTWKALNWTGPAETKVSWARDQRRRR